MTFLQKCERALTEVPRARTSARAPSPPAPRLCRAQEVMPYLTLLDGNVLRMCCRDLRDAVADAPWLDERTRVRRVSSWHAAFPRARAANLSAKPPTDSHGQARRYYSIKTAEMSRVTDRDLTHLSDCVIVNLKDQMRVGDAGAGALRAVRKLAIGVDRTMRGEQWRLTDAGLRSINPALKELELWAGTRITGAAGGFERLEQLEVLQLHSTSLVPAAYASLRSLTTLTFEGWAGEPPGDAALAALAARAPGQLRVLSVAARSSFTDAGLRVCTGLTSLTLQNNHAQISAAGLVRTCGTRTQHARPHRASSRLSSITSALLARAAAAPPFAGSPQWHPAQAQPRKCQRRCHHCGC